MLPPAHWPPRLGEIALPGVSLFGATLVGLFLVVSFALVVILAVSRWVRYVRERRLEHCRRFLREASGYRTDAEDVAAVAARRPFIFLRAYVECMNHTVLPDRLNQTIERALRSISVDTRLIRDLNSNSPFRRGRGALYLAYVPSVAGAAALDNRLRTEGSYSVKLRIVYAIVKRRYIHSVPTIFDSLRDAPEDYRERVYGLLSALGHQLEQLLPVMQDRREPEIQTAFVRAAAQVPTDAMRYYLRALVHTASRGVARNAFQVLVNHFFEIIDPNEYANSGDRFFVNLAVEALGRAPSPENVEAILPHLATAETRKSAVVALSEMIRTAPRLIPKLITVMRTDPRSDVREGLAEALAARSEHVLLSALREQWGDARTVLSLLLRTGNATGILSLLNRNTDTEREAAICSLIGDTVRSDRWLLEEYGLYAKDTVLRRLGIERRQIDSRRGERRAENSSKPVLAAIIVATLLGPPAVFVLVQAVLHGGVAWQSFPRDYLVQFELGFVAYAFTLNTVYLILLLAAVRAVLQTERLWELRPLELLFKEGVLPSVSIIAPAYNEEATIVESVTALLNLRYPDYEVIVVNDGSLDATLQQLISTFELERGSLFVHNYLHTRPIRGIYRNPRIPGLLVIDKSNGGKADSLNAGINASRKDYFAAIDADSLLEPDALLHLATEFLDCDLPVAAVGGNVLPINGCLVERGHIDEIRLPRRRLARFQMVEYIRGFMTGRTGWAHLDSLLIISGAFGLFNKMHVIDARGYLTSSERLSKDTVAEDMELVVRVTRRLRDAGSRATIRYASGANCWTEVPESAAILASQRDRWQRGLIDVLFYHAGMALRPRYGRPATLGLPYHYVFELVGPWIELQGYLFFIAGLMLGILPGSVVLAVVVSAMLLGAITSLLSLQLAEWQRPMFRFRDRLLVIWTAVLENFGYRLFAALLRLRGYVSVLRQRTGWGTMRRRGFQQKVLQEKVR